MLAALLCNRPVPAGVPRRTYRLPVTTENEEYPEVVEILGADGRVVRTVRFEDLEDEIVPVLLLISDWI